jgi:hypothetical protein
MRRSRSANSRSFAADGTQAAVGRCFLARAIGASRESRRSCLPINSSQINSFSEMQSCAADVTGHLEKALDPVVAGVSTLGPIASWLFRDKRKLCNSLHILQADLYRKKLGRNDRMDWTYPLRTAWT